MKLNIPKLTRPLPLTDYAPELTHDDGSPAVVQVWVNPPQALLTRHAELRARGQAALKRVKEVGDDQAAAAEVVAEVLDALRGFMQRGIPVVAYNAPYDFTILKYEALRHGLEPILEPFPVLDPLVIDKKVDQYRSGKRRLENAAAVYGVELSDAHNATADAVAAGRVMQAIAEKFGAQLGDDVAKVHAGQAIWADEQAESFAVWRRKNGAPDFVAELGWPLKSI